MTLSRPVREHRAELDEIAGLASPLNDRTDLDPLLDRIGDARFVLLGEASHGTSDYYLAGGDHPTRAKRNALLTTVAFPAG